MKKRFPLINLDNQIPDWRTPQEKTATISERIERAKRAIAQADMALVGRPVQDPKPVKHDPDYYAGQYVGLTWRGQKIKIKKHKWDR